jgi:hypothetical protein
VYCANYSIDGYDYTQAAIAIAWPVISSGQEMQSWAKSLNRFKPIWTAILLSYDGRRIKRTLVVTCEAHRASALRRLIASLSRVERSLGGSIELPSNAEQHDAMAIFNTREALRLHSPVFDHAGDLWTGPSGSAYRYLDAIFERAILEDQQITYQAILTLHTPSLEVLRILKRSGVKLRDVAGFGIKRLTGLESVASSYPTSAFLVSESIAIKGADAEWLEDLVRRLSSEDMRHPPEITRDGDDLGGREIAIDLEAHGRAPQEYPFEVAAAAAPADLIVELLTWRPTSVAAELIERSDTSSDDGNLGGPLPGAPGAPGEFFFVSYSRKDGPQIAPLLDEFVSAGVPIWYDAGIEAGAAWVQTLEERLERCTGVLLFVSPDAVNSRYVRSEVTFAYVLNKLFFPIVLREAVLPSGLRIVLSGIQFARASELQDRDRLTTRLKQLISSR